jgi:O-antigen/teichoic acid export membrane protein
LNKSLLRQASPLLIGRAFSAVLTFAIPIFVARQMNQHDYGTYKQFFLIAATLYMMGQIGLTAGLYYFIPRGGAERGRYIMGTLAGLVVCGAAAGLLILAGVGELAYRFDNPDIARLAWPLAVYGMATIGAAPLEIMLTASKKTGWAGITYILSDIARTFALIAPMQSGLGLEGIAWGAAGFALARVVATWILALAETRGQARRPTRQTVRAQLAYSLPFAGAVLFSVGTMHFPSYAVSAFTDAATFAVYAVGALQIPLTDVLYSPVAEVMIVRLAQVGRGGAPPVFHEAVSKLAIFFLPLAAFVWAIGPVLIPTLFGHQYLAAVPIFAIAIAELPLSVVPADALLRGVDATRTIFRVNLARMLLVIVLVPVGLKTVGLVGAMAGFVATQYFAKAYMVRAAARVCGVRVRDMMPLRPLAGWLGRSAFIFAAITLVRVVGPWHGVTFLLAASAIGGGLWLVCLYTAGELRRATSVEASVG